MKRAQVRRTQPGQWIVFITTGAWWRALPACATQAEALDKALVEVGLRAPLEHREAP